MLPTAQESRSWPKLLNLKRKFKKTSLKWLTVKMPKVAYRLMSDGFD